MKKSARIKRGISLVLLFLLLTGMVFSVIRMIHAPAQSSLEHEKLKSDYLLMALQCTAGLIVMLLPSFLEKKLRLPIPDTLRILYDVFLFCAVYLGEIWNFYYRVPHWDSVLHYFSGLLLGALGFILLKHLNRSDLPSAVRSGPFFACLFVFCFAMAVGSIWEIYEYTFDSLMGLNMQKYALENHVLKSGRDALTDTMKDIIFDAAAALTAAVAAFYSVRKSSLRT